MKCLETRVRKGMKWRRYRTADGATWTTYEVPVSVISYLSTKALKAALEAANARLARLDRNARIKAMCAQKIKVVAIAHEEGITEARVRQILRSIKEKKA